MTPSDRLRAVFPWGVESGVRTYVLTLFCGVALGVSWYEVGGRGLFEEQVRWCTIGVLVLLVTMYFQASLVIRGRRAVGARRSRLITDLVADQGLLPADPSLVAEVSESPRRPAATEDLVLVGRQLTMYHRPSCPMTTGRGMMAVPRAVAQRDRLQPCGICLHPGSIGSRSTEDAHR